MIKYHVTLRVSSTPGKYLISPVEVAITIPPAMPTYDNVKNVSPVDMAMPSRTMPYSDLILK
jgi:hypothetical protein